MFTGIIETQGRLVGIQKQGSNLLLDLESTISNELRVDQSLAHNGVCLTVVKKGNGKHSVVAVKETIERSNLGNTREGDAINLERALKVGDRLDGHFVQGHVDETSKIIAKIFEDGSWRIRFPLSKANRAYVIPKGSICVNGVSLTIAELTAKFWEVVVIPYTYEHTNLSELQVGDAVNLEYDMLGKYMNRISMG